MGIALEIFMKTRKKEKKSSHKDTKIEKPFMAFYLFFFFVSSCLCVFVSL